MAVIILISKDLSEIKGDEKFFIFTTFWVYLCVLLSVEVEIKFF